MGTQRTPGRQRTQKGLFVVLVCCLLAPHAAAHDLERTQVELTLSRDASFVLDVANDPAWLALRTASVPGPFVDRVVLWVDGHEVRPATDEVVTRGALTVHRLRGALPRDARTLRWYYGLVIDPYPLTVHRPDGRILTEVVEGDAWSGEIDLRGQFSGQSRWAIFVVVGLFAAVAALRLTRPRNKLSTTEDTGDTEKETLSS